MNKSIITITSDQPAIPTALRSVCVSLDVDHVLVEANMTTLQALSQYEPEAVTAFGYMWRAADNLDRLILCQLILDKLGAQ